MNECIKIIKEEKKIIIIITNNNNKTTTDARMWTYGWNGCSIQLIALF